MKGWEEPDGRVAVWQQRRRQAAGGSLASEGFADDPARPAALTDWSRLWKQWAAEERPAQRALRAFEWLYELHNDIERQGERIEVVLADGRLKWRTPEGVIDHPILFQRVDLVFDPDVPEFRVVDSDRLPELCAPLLLAGGSLSGERLNELRRELERGGFHPLEADETSGFLRRLVSLLGPAGVLQEDRDAIAAAPAAEPVMLRDPWLLVRNRAAGFAAAFDRVLEDIEHRRELPVALTRMVGIERPLPRAEAADEPGRSDEPAGTLFSKPANTEQLEIVRTLAQYQAALVQGPPGTGKSHTIANLVGHLIAKGARVLVTSYTSKALRVVREHLVEELRPLSVALLDNDLEGRTQMEEAVQGIVQRLSTTTEERLEADVAALTRERDGLFAEVERLTGELRAVRENEYRPIELGAEVVAPSDAARFVAAHAPTLSFLPGPITPGAPLPLSEGELGELYASNQIAAQSGQNDGQNDVAFLPAPSEVPAPAEFERDVAAFAGEASEAERFWRRPHSADDAPALAAVERAIDQLVGDVAGLSAWQRRLCVAGHAAGAEQEFWRELSDQIEEAVERWEEGHALLLEHEPVIATAVPRKEARVVLDEIVAHVREGGKASGLSVLFRGKWKSVLDGCRTGGVAPSELGQFEALATLARIEEARLALSERWVRRAEPAGLPAFGSLPNPPEPALAEYVRQFEPLFRFWAKRWHDIEAQLAVLEFDWGGFRADRIAKVPPSAPFEGELAMVGGPLREAVARRRAVGARGDMQARWQVVARDLERSPAPICHALGAAVARFDVAAYAREHARLVEAWRRQATVTRRRSLLAAMAASAPGWAAAIEAHQGVHGASAPPSDVAAAWRWRTLADELDRRNARDETTLAARLEEQRAELQKATVALCDRKAWLEQLRRTGLEARQALIGWADTQRKIGKGTGKRAPELQLKARDLLARAREAVPVWIMPLARVAESFDPRHGRFDVVIIDEASQCDLTGLLAIYLGRQVAIVGDHEQVSPSAVGEASVDVSALINQFLGGIPNSHLYDGQTSVYDLARQSFGGTIGLREHFRCVPDIIEFSNQLSYGGEIRPLRDPNTGLTPHLCEYHVSQALAPARQGQRNEAEARALAALVAATMRLPEYEGKTFGAISLLGDEQAGRIAELVQRLVPLDELERRRFVAGNPAQFQGDERDVIFLSMVDAPTGEVLPLQDRTTIKQRYNVAASRARDQLWLVHSLDPRRDLQAGDLRRRLIEHVRTFGRYRRGGNAGTGVGAGTATTKVKKPESTTSIMRLQPGRSPSPLERAVYQRLVAAGFETAVQVPVGGYRIDLVVRDVAQQVAIECDGDRALSLERIPDEMAKQAVLERVGWRFRRIRGTRFYRDPDATMAALFEELHALGIEPLPGEGEQPSRATPAEDLENRIIRRAWQIMREEDWVRDPKTPPPPPQPGRGAQASTTLRPGDVEELPPEGPVAELVIDEATDPRFVIR